MNALDQDASVEQVGEVLAGKRIAPRDFTTVLTQLKQRRAWRLALRVGEWLHLHASSTLPNRAHHQVMRISEGRTLFEPCLSCGDMYA